MSAETLVSILKGHADRTPEAPFIEHLASGSTISYRAAWRTAQQLSMLLGRLGVGRRARVVFAVRNHWLLLPMLVACSGRRATLVPMDPDLHRDERRFILSSCAPALVITADADSFPVAPGHAPTTLTISRLLESLEAEGAASEDLLDPDPGAPDDVVLFIYTSGTTGSSKAAMLTNANLLANAAALVERYAVGDRDRVLCILPTHHMNAIMITGIVPLAAGASICLSEALSFRNAKLFWRNVAQQRITICSLVPSIMALLLKLFPNGPDVPVSALRFAFCGAAPLPAETWRQFEDVFARPVHQGYGLTESTCWAVSSPVRGPRSLHSVGAPLSCCEVRIGPPVREAEIFLLERDAPAPVAPSVPGEILLRGPIVGPGYYKNPRLTRETTTEDGFFRTGDLGFFDADGYLHVIGRIKEIIIRNGANVVAGDLDRVLLQHDAIQACKTIGIPDPLVGERIHCVCVSDQHGAIKPGTVRAWVQDRISPRLWPDALTLMGYLPTGATGKVSINLLRKIVTGELSEEILSCLCSPKYRRAPPSDPDATRKVVQRSLIQGQPIHFLAYWGCGPRHSMAPVDLLALERLRDLIDGARRIPEAPPRLTLIFTDVHARNNRVPEERLRRYFEEIRLAAEGLGMNALYLSEIWDEAGLTSSRIQAAVYDPDSEYAWRGLSLRDRLVDQAGKHLEESTGAEEAARFYYLACRHEGPLIASRYPESLFITYNHPDFDGLLPALPKLYLYSYKMGSSAKPWFLGAEAADRRATG